MRFSIIIPVYNAEKYIDRLLTSIKNQTFQDYELIIVNDGSTDNSLNILQKYKQKDNNLTIYSKNNEGPGISRKFGFEKSTGELLFFIDSDDYLKDNNVLERIDKLYSEKNFDVLFFDFLSIKGNKISKKNLLFNKKYACGKHEISELDETIVKGALWGKIIKRKYLKSEDFYNSNNFEDYYTTYCFLENCSNFYYTDEAFYVTDRNNVTSLTKEMNVSKISDAIDIIFKIYEKSTLKKSISLLALHYYIYGYWILSKVNDGDKSKIVQKLESLRSIIPKHTVIEIIKKFNIKYLIYYIYIKARRRK